MEQVVQDAALRIELGAVPSAIARAMQKLDDPRELNLTVAELARAAVRLTEANAKAIKARRNEGSYLTGVCGWR